MVIPTEDPASQGWTHSPAVGQPGPGMSPGEGISCRVNYKGLEVWEEKLDTRQWTKMKMFSFAPGKEAKHSDFQLSYSKAQCWYSQLGSELDHFCENRNTVRNIRGMKGIEAGGPFPYSTRSFSSWCHRMEALFWILKFRTHWGKCECWNFCLNPNL